MVLEHCVFVVQWRIRKKVESGLEVTKHTRRSSMAQLRLGDQKVHQPFHR